MKPPTEFILPLAMATAAAIALSISAQADTMYNVLTGQNREPGGGLAILPANDVRGPADLSTTNQTWNGFSDNSHLTGTLKTSDGTVTTVTYTSGAGGEWGSQGGTGSPIYASYVYHPDTASFTGLNPTSTYDVYVLASSYWGDRGGIGVTQTAGTGLTGTFWINRNGNPPADPLSFLQDTNPSDTTANFDYALFTSLTPSGGGALSFSYAHSGRDGNSIAGYQLVEHPSLPLDHFEVTASSPQRTGTAFSVTVTAKDIDGKTIPDSTTPVTMTSTGSAQFDSDANGTFGDNIKTLSSGTFTITTKDAVAESVTFTATGGDKTGSSSPITVSAPPPPEIVSFGTGTTQFSLTFSQVTAACNVGDTEVLNDAFNKFYLATKGVAYAANAGLALTDTACNVSGVEVVDFINWLNTSSGLPAAYTFNGAHTALVNWNRTPGAKFFLPTVAEWNGALVYLNYAPGPCTDEWIQDTDGGGENLDGVMDGTANKSWDDGFTGSYDNVGFRVISDPNVSIATGALDHFAITAASPQTAGAAFSVTVTAKDASGNTVASDSSTVVTLTSNTGHAQFDSNADGTFGDNTKTLASGTFTITTKDNTAESLTLTATGGGKTGSSSSITIRSQFDAWIAGAPQTGFTDDPNQDGVVNGLAWLLHGTAMGNSRTCLPLATTAAGKLVLSFQCLKASARGAAVLNVQYSKDLGVLDAWHTAAVPDSTPAGEINGVVFTVTPITASDYQTITAEIPLSAASSDGKLFGRLQGTE